VVVINEALAQKYWPGRDPLGHTIRLLADSAPWMTIVGVVGDVRHGGYQEEAPPTMYIPHEQAGITAYYWPPSMSLLLRTDGDPSSLVPAVRRLLREIDPALPLARVATMESLVSASVASRRFATQLLAGFAALALFLAAIGIYGVIAWGVTQRRFELGLRMALGATGPRVARLIVSEGLALTATGLVLGVAGGMVVLRLARAMLVDVSVADPITLVVVIALLGAVAVLASWLPARRATRVEPTVALREG
jgi:putative ABC transport system permease protein